MPAYSALTMAETRAFLNSAWVGVLVDHALEGGNVVVLDAADGLFQTELFVVVDVGAGSILRIADSEIVSEIVAQCAQSPAPFDFVNGIAIPA